MTFNNWTFTINSDWGYYGNFEYVFQSVLITNQIDYNIKQLLLRSQFGMMVVMMSGMFGR